MSPAKTADSSATARRRAGGRRRSPPTPPPKKSPWRHWRWWAAAAVLVLGGLFARLFVVPSVEEAAQADAVVVFDGDGPGRLERALELMNGQSAAVLVLPNGSNPAWPAANRMCAGEAPFEVLCPAADPATPRGEAQLIGTLATERAWARVAIVTDPANASRASLLVDRCTTAEVVRVAPMEPPGIGSRLAGAPAESLRYLAALAFRRGC
jgi:hypothetical protein